MDMLPPAGGDSAAKAAQLESILLDQALRIALLNQGRLILTAEDGGPLPGVEKAVHLAVRDIGTLGMTLARLHRTYGADPQFKFHVFADGPDPRTKAHAEAVSRNLRGDPEERARAAKAEVLEGLGRIAESMIDMREEDEAWLTALEERVVALDPSWPDRESFARHARQRGASPGEDHRASPLRGTSPVSTGEDEWARAVQSIFPRLIAGEVPCEAGGWGPM